MRRWEWVIALALGAATWVAPLHAEGQVRQYTVHVETLACPYCAYGLERKLRELEGVTGVQLDFAEARVVIEVAPEAQLEPSQLVEAVREAGLGPRATDVDVLGTIRGSGDAMRLSTGGRSSFRIREGRGSEALEHAMAEGHRRLAVKGRVVPFGDGWAIVVVGVEIPPPAEP